MQICRHAYLTLDSYVQNKQTSIDRPVSASTRMSSKWGAEKESMSSTFTDGFAVGHRIPELPKDKWILDFEKSEIEILKEIAEIIRNEQKELEEEIEVQQDIIMNRGKPRVKEEPEAALIEEPSSKELYEFKNRLEVNWWSINSLGDLPEVRKRKQFKCMIFSWSQQIKSFPSFAE